VPIFFDRQEAAYLLFEKLAVFAQHRNAIVLGLAPGGAILSASLRRKLKIPYNVLTPRKLGAVSQDGYYWLNTSLVHLLGLSNAWKQQTLDLETKKFKI
jgi:predicted phosphoribosyltransferase